MIPVFPNTILLQLNFWMIDWNHIEELTATFDILRYMLLFFLSKEERTAVLWVFEMGVMLQRSSSPTTFLPTLPLYFQQDFVVFRSSKSCRKRPRGLRFAKTPLSMVSNDNNPPSQDSSDSKNENIIDTLNHQLEEQRVQQDDEKSLRQLGATELETLKEDLVQDLSTLNEKQQYGDLDSLIDEETKKLLYETEQKQLDILQSIKNDKNLIREQTERMQRLYDDKRLEPASVVQGPLGFTAVLLAIAALFYAYDAVASRSAQALRFASIDSALSAACAFLNSRAIMRKQNQQRQQHQDPEKKSEK